MDARCRITLLGGLRIEQDGRVITRFPSHMTGALLAYLAFHRHRAHSRELLIEIVWPEEDLEQARDRLRVALSSLRRQLEPPGVPCGSVILAGRRSVQLNPSAVSSDVAAFEAAIEAARHAAGAGERGRWLAEALDQYQGELLPDYFEPWILPEQQRLAGLYFQAARELIHYREHSGDSLGALDIAGRAVAADPLREEAQHELIRLLAATGQSTAAMNQYRQFERLVAAEMDAPPSEAMRQLVATIERQPAGALGAAPVSGHPQGGPPQAPVGTQDTAASRSASIPTGSQEPARVGRPTARSQEWERTDPLPLQLTRFIGRKRELAELRTWLRDDSIRLVTLTGPGGSGKTPLAIEAARVLVGHLSCG